MRTVESNPDARPRLFRTLGWTVVTSTTTRFTPNTPPPTEPPLPSFPTAPPTIPPSPSGSVQAVAIASSPSGEVAGVTAKPHITPPPTSSAGLPGTPSDGTWRIALLAMAGLLALVLVLTPARIGRRR